MISLLRLSELHCVRRWMLAHKADHPVEYHCWDAVMTLCVMGAMGWAPALILEQGWWALPLCALGFCGPTLYVYRRLRAHAQGRLRCDWAWMLPSRTVGA